MRIFKERTEWFDIPNDKHNGKLKIKYLNEGQQQEIVAKGRTLTFVSVDGVMENRMVPDEVTLRKETVVERVVDWENMLGKQGEKLSCDRKNKIAFSREDGFMDVLAELMATLDEAVKKERGDEEKNLSKSQDGSQA